MQSLTQRRGYTQVASSLTHWDWLMTLKRRQGFNLLRSSTLVWPWLSFSSLLFKLPQQAKAPSASLPPSTSEKQITRNFSSNFFFSPINFFSVHQENDENYCYE
ncbi:hypothetical protein PIB30_116977 [Stylosanthes scabra]|uniref:Uncharacterized protein n=1 Tax=Stylosanthes scabra TaxID=79078 RepID=A0ABU6Z961_9FABA|nr:hypothetical protein [Stylosanthes scabra]